MPEDVFRNVWHIEYEQNGNIHLWHGVEEVMLPPSGEVWFYSPVRVELAGPGSMEVVTT